MLPGGFKGLIISIHGTRRSSLHILWFMHLKKILLFLPDSWEYSRWTCLHCAHFKLQVHIIYIYHQCCFVGFKGVTRFDWFLMFIPVLERYQLLNIPNTRWHWYWVFQNKFVPAWSWYRVQGWFLAGIRQVYSIYVVWWLVQPLYEAGMTSVPLSQVLVWGWYCLRSYESRQFFDTRTGTSLHTRVRYWYKPNIGSYFILQGAVDPLRMQRFLFSLVVDS